MKHDFSQYSSQGNMAPVIAALEDITTAIDAITARIEIAESDIEELRGGSTAPIAMSEDIAAAAAATDASTPEKVAE